MQQIFRLLSKNSTRLLFLLLFAIALFLTVNTHYFHKGLYMSSANVISGSYFEKKHEVTEFLHLKEDNLALAAENKRLKERLYHLENQMDSIFTTFNSQDSTKDFKVLETKIINNSFLNKTNYLTIKGGRNLGIKKDMGVIGTNGIVGIIETTSPNFATVQSVLNTNTKIGAKVKKTDHFGTIVWDGEDPHYVNLIDIPKSAKIAKGDSIVSGGISTIFPENIPIGTIENIYTSKSSNFLIIKVKLSEDMTKSNHVYIIENQKIEEINQLEQELKNE